MSLTRSTPDDLKRGTSYSRIEAVSLCPRKWYWRYVAKLPEAPAIPRDFSSILVHKPFALWLKRQFIDWQVLNLEYLQLTQQLVPHSTYNLEAARAIFEEISINYAHLLERPLEAVEETLMRPLCGGRPYNSKPDAVFREQPGDINGRVFYDYTPFDLKARSRDAIKVPFDQQLVGQAYVCHTDHAETLEAVFNVSKKSGVVSVELAFDELDISQRLMLEWQAETEMEAKRIDEYFATGVWPKRSPFACRSYGRDCEYVGNCAGGLPDETLHDKG